LRVNRPCKVIQWLLQQRTGAGRAGIGDQKPDVKIVGQESRDPDWDA
jgi:hypothetical protein